MLKKKVYVTKDLVGHVMYIASKTKNVYAIFIYQPQIEDQNGKHSKLHVFGL